MVHTRPTPAVVNIAGSLRKAAWLEAFEFGDADVIYAGLGDDFVHVATFSRADGVAYLSAELDADDFADMFKDFSDVREFDDALRNNFVGIFDTFRDYADEAAEESLAAHGIKGDNPLARYFNYESWARDLSMDMRTIDVPSGIAIFYA